MKKNITILIALIAIGGFAQNNDTSFKLGNGLNIETEKGKYHFNIGGFIQAGGGYSELKGTDPEYRFDINRAYLNLNGGLNYDLFNFKFQMDFTQSYPLLDAWFAYNPQKNLSISVGQKQSLSGTRSMMFDDQALALGYRSLVNNTFYNTGRELGLFVETRLPIRKIGFDLGIAVTTGDGINSFGSSSTDFDLGGLKYSAQATFYPLGFFSEGNHLTDTDFAHEKTPKLLIGGSYSYNNGASNAIGEGHGSFILYDANGKNAFPDYIKASLNILFKYRGFTFLSEYVDAWARNLDNIYLTASASSKLQPKQIANYLVLGSGISLQAGYLFRKNWAIDLRYSHLMPEWREKQELIKKTDGISVGLAKYIIDNRIKLQLVGQYENYSELDKQNKMFMMGINTHIVF